MVERPHSLIEFQARSVFTLLKSRLLVSKGSLVVNYDVVIEDDEDTASNSSSTSTSTTTAA